MDIDLAGNFSSAFAPDSVRGHRLVQGRYFFTLPIELLEAVVAAVGEARFDADVVDLDRVLSRECGDHSAQVGYRDGAPVRYDLIGDPLDLTAAVLEGTQQFAGELKWPALSVEQLEGCANLEQRSSWARGVARGFAGWLSANATFVQEQHDFFTKWATQCTRYGLSGPSPKLSGPQPRANTAAADYFPFVTARDAFLTRWSLRGLAGPFLASSPMPDFGAGTGDLSASARPPGLTMSYPSIFPTPEPQVLRAMIEEAIARRRKLPEHLRAWGELVEGDSQAKKAIAGHARVFLLQHCWRLLFSRHAEALAGHVHDVRLAVATFLGVGEESIRKDLTTLAKARGGAGWYATPSVYDSL
jgi:hypothetical protein